MATQPTIPAEALRRLGLRLTRAVPLHPEDPPAIDGLIEAAFSEDGRRLSLAYDVRLTALDSVVAQLRERGHDIAVGRLTRVRIAWQGYLDRNARANLTLPGSPCCSNPTTVYAARKRRP